MSLTGIEEYCYKGNIETETSILDNIKTLQNPHLFQGHVPTPLWGHLTHSSLQIPHFESLRTLLAHFNIHLHHEENSY